MLTSAEETNRKIAEWGGKPLRHASADYVIEEANRG